MPATTVAWPPTASIAARKRSRRSSSVRFGLSPVVPATTIPSDPFSTRYRARRWNASKSIDSSSRNGVTIAVRMCPSIRWRILAAMARFVLVHGAWHGGWCFRRLADELEERGHEVDGSGSSVRRGRADAVDYARLVGPQPDAIVVGHSLGGFDDPADRRTYTRLPRRAVCRSRTSTRKRSRTVSAGSCATSSTGRTGRMPTLRPRGCTPIARAPTPTGPSPGSAVRRRSTRCPPVRERRRRDRDASGRRGRRRLADSRRPARTARG